MALRTRCLLAVLFGHLVAVAEAMPVALPDGVRVGPMQVLEDPDGGARLEQVLAQRGRFANVADAGRGYGFTASAFWYRIPVDNRGAQAAALFLNVQFPSLDYLTLYVLEAGRVRRVVESGDRIPARQRPYDALMLPLPFEVGAHRSVELYLRVQPGDSSMLAPLAVQDERAVRASDGIQRLIQEITIGIFIALFFQNLLAYALLRDRSYLYFVLFLPFVLLTIVALHGFAAAVLFPGATWPHNEGVMVFVGGSYVAFLLYTRSFLRTAEQPRLDRVLKVLMAAAAVIGLSPFVLSARATYVIGNPLSLIVPLVLLVTGIVRWRAGQRQARFYIFASATYLLTVFGYGATVAGALPFSLALFEAFTLGIAASAMLLSLAQVDSIRTLQNATLLAQAQARRNLELRREELERIVAERTADLDKAREQAERLATSDPLTGIFNRRGVLEPAAREVQMALRHDRPLAAVLFDLDRFKGVNDRYGHAEGDRVLCEVVAAVREIIRETDLFGRIGGDEFLVILPDTGTGLAAEIAERIRVRIAERVRVGDPSERVTASFGVASITVRTGDIEALENAADNALYRAKHNGRNRIELALAA